MSCDEHGGDVVGRDRGLIAVLCITSIIFATFSLGAYASTAAEQAPRSGGGGLLFALAIAYLSRRRAIGGWLLYFFVQLYLGFAISIALATAITLPSLAPSGWDNATLYVFFFLSTVPFFVATCVEVIAATLLLRRRTEAALVFLRRTLVGLLIVGAASVAIDVVYFSDDPGTIFDVIAFLFSCIWTAYFYKSNRVRLVFVENAWDYSHSGYSAYSVPTMLSPAQLAYRRTRTIVLTCATFVVVLAVFGISAGNKAPTAEILIAPALWAGFAAIFGWFLPVRARGEAPKPAALSSHIK